MLCRCRDMLLRESGCPVHGPFVPSARERRSDYARASLSILSAVIERSNRFHEKRNAEMTEEIIHAGNCVFRNGRIVQFGSGGSVQPAQRVWFSIDEVDNWKPQEGPQADFFASSRSGKTNTMLDSFLGSVGSPLTTEDFFPVEGESE